VLGVIGYGELQAEAPTFCVAWARTISGTIVRLELQELEGDNAPRADWSDADWQPALGDMIAAGDFSARVMSVERVGNGEYDAQLSSVAGLAEDTLVTLTRATAARRKAHLRGRFSLDERGRETDMVPGAPQVAFATLDANETDWDPGADWAWCDVLVVAPDDDWTVNGLTAWGVRQRAKTIINQGPGTLTIGGGNGNDPCKVNTPGNDGDEDIVLAPGEAAIAVHCPVLSEPGWFAAKVSPPLPNPSAIWGANVFWWDPSDDDSITIDTGAGAWIDKSATYTLLQATDANQPTLADVLDFRQGLVFDGSNDFLRATGLSGLTGDVFTLIHIYRHTGAPAANRSWASLSDGATVSCGLVNSNSGGTECAVHRGAGDASPHTADSLTDGDTDWHIAVARMAPAGTSFDHIVLDGIRTNSGSQGENIHAATDCISLGVHATGAGVVGLESLDFVIVKGECTDAQLNAFARWARNEYPSLPAWTDL
jgi:hypothetical protein